MTLRATAIILICVTSTQSIDAGYIISNLPPDNDNVSLFIGGSADIRRAVGFTMPGGNSFSLDSVTLRVSAIDSTDTPLVRLFSDSSGNPGSPLLTFTALSNTVGISEQTLTPLTSFTIAPSTTYWLVVENQGAPAGQFNWLGNSPSLTPTGTATFAGSRISLGSIPTGNSPNIPSFAISATVVPAPSSLVLFGLGGAGLLGMARLARRMRIGQALFGTPL